MREGLGERGLWFAGEHVAPFVALGTVTGAWWSGEAVAKRIIAAYGGGAPDDAAVGVAPDEQQGLDGADTSKNVNLRTFGDDALVGSGNTSV